MDKWISVAERLPDNSRSVLVYDGPDDDLGEHYIAYYDNTFAELTGWYDKESGMEVEGIKFWMELPTLKGNTNE